MKKKKFFALSFAILFLSCFFCACGSSSQTFTNPGDYLGGGGTVSETIELSTSEYYDDMLSVVSSLSAGVSDTSTLPEGVTEITSENLEISESGEYFVTGTLEEKIEITADAENVVLYLVNATLSCTKKVIDCSTNLTIILIGDNSITNSNTSGSNAIDCVGDLIIAGSGSLSISSTKNAIKANSISIFNATIEITAEKDGLHAEVDAYDDAESQPTPTYSDGGFVYLNGATVTIVSADDGIQADTFVYITESTVTITAGGGAPETVTETSSDNASGKGIKAGQIDWGKNEEDLEWSGYLLVINSGEITINSNDDALHSNGELLIYGGTINLSSGDDAIHSDNLLQIFGGEISITKCYEGIESAKVEIAGGTIDIQSYEDGINAADGTTTQVNVSNSNCHIIITGGYISVDCIGSEGDGIDSNGSILISGGQLYISGSSNSADSALDADGGILVNGGYVFAVGALGMVETPATNSEQYCVSFAKNSSISAGTTLYLCDESGNIIMYFTTQRSCQSIIISCPEFEKGKTYSLYGGDTLLASFTITSTITTISSSSSISNPGGSPNGNTPGLTTPGFNRR